MEILGTKTYYSCNYGKVAHWINKCLGIIIIRGVIIKLRSQISHRPLYIQMNLPKLMRAKNSACDVGWRERYNQRREGERR